jgi:hypothetical protein
MQYRRQRPENADEAAGGDGTGTDIEDVSVSDVARAHVADQRCALGSKRRPQRLAEEAYHRNEHQIREHSAGAHDARDARADDVADTEQLRRNLR